MLSCLVLLASLSSGERPGLGIFGFFIVGLQNLMGIFIYGRFVDWALGKGRLGEQRLVPALESLLVNLGNMFKQNEAKESTWSCAL